MIAVITGDIINSRLVEPSLWLPNLKEILNTIGKEPQDWEIYRGDSFQLKVDAKNALYVALIIKASIKEDKNLDVRMAIGIGKIEYPTKKITESNGSAFVHSGECFDVMKRETLMVRSSNQEFDHIVNLLLSLATLTINSWTPATSEIIKTTLIYPNKSQKELAEFLNKKSQGNISEHLKRGGYDEILRLHNYYKEKIVALC
nr:SatD family protein [uncultured Brumimicrobium sp.]